MQVQGGVAKEGEEDETGHEGLQHFQQAWYGAHSRDLTELIVLPQAGHFRGIKYRSNTGEGSGLDGSVPVRP